MVRKATAAAKLKRPGISAYQRFRINTARLSFFNDIFKAADVRSVLSYIFLTHHKTDAADIFNISEVEVLRAVKRDITPFHRKILPVLHRCSYYLPCDTPEIRRQLRVILRRQPRHAAADKPHLEMIERKIRIAVFFKYHLCQPGLSGMCLSSNKNDHIITPLYCITKAGQNQHICTGLIFYIRCDII